MSAISPLYFCRALFLSDLHLGSKDCKADYLLDLLAQVRPEQLFLVGDVVDLWSLKRQPFWPESHQAVLVALRALAQRGTRVMYIPGNHDAALREFVGSQLLGVELQEEWVYTTAQGKRLLLIHGDQFDGAVMVGRFTSWLGDRGYDLLLWLNRWSHYGRRRIGLSYWSLASFLKNRVQLAQQAVERFVRAAVHEAKERGLDGIVCGHIHAPDLRTQAGILYCNTGDWVENCTALLEQRDGQLTLLHWSEVQRQLAVHQQPSAA
ncbi:MAG: UDP-2,3-diacylglucosamine diphosphatase [Aeromonadaceae bacterium]|nr:UDP-2,3-diacylglucosamine diphosphatase [Aeromonadaceae bacterium]